MYQAACGHPPPEEQHEEALEQFDPQGPVDELPIEIPPIADINFSVLADWQVGQGIDLFRSPLMISSKTLPQSLHRYSYIGI